MGRKSLKTPKTSQPGRKSSTSPKYTCRQCEHQFTCPHALHMHRLDVHPRDESPEPLSEEEKQAWNARIEPIIRLCFPGWFAPGHPLRRVCERLDMDEERYKLPIDDDPHLAAALEQAELALRDRADKVDDEHEDVDVDCDDDGVLFPRVNIPRRHIPKDASPVVSVIRRQSPRISIPMDADCNLEESMLEDREPDAYIAMEADCNMEEIMMEGEEPHAFTSMDADVNLEESMVEDDLDISFFVDNLQIETKENPAENTSSSRAVILSPIHDAATESADANANAATADEPSNADDDAATSNYDGFLDDQNDSGIADMNSSSTAAFDINHRSNDRNDSSADDELDAMEDIIAGDAATVAAANLLAAEKVPSGTIYSSDETKEDDDPRDFDKTFAHGSEYDKSKSLDNRTTDKPSPAFSAVEVVVGSVSPRTIAVDTYPCDDEAFFDLSVDENPLEVVDCSFSEHLTKDQENTCDIIVLSPPPRLECVKTAAVVPTQSAHSTNNKSRLLDNVEDDNIELPTSPQLDANVDIKNESTATTTHNNPTAFVSKRQLDPSSQAIKIDNDEEDVQIIEHVCSPAITVPAPQLSAEQIKAAREFHLRRHALFAVMLVESMKSQTAFNEVQRLATPSAVPILRINGPPSNVVSQPKPEPAVVKPPIPSTADPTVQVGTASSPTTKAKRDHAVVTIDDDDEVQVIEHKASVPPKPVVATSIPASASTPATPLFTREHESILVQSMRVAVAAEAAKKPAVVSPQTDQTTRRIDFGEMITIDDDSNEEVTDVVYPDCQPQSKKAPHQPTSILREEVRMRSGAERTYPTPQAAKRLAPSNAEVPVVEKKNKQEKSEEIMVIQL